MKFGVWVEVSECSMLPDLRSRSAQGYETLTVKNSFTKFIFSAVYSGS